MKVVTSFPHKVHVIENCWIPLSDGRRLAARVWLPEEAENEPVPAILEYIPYRKRDFARGRDEPIHSYFAGHGYAAVRVDLRGSGDSDGVLFDEYLSQEQDDAVEVIRWIAAQPWCTGAVGMMGISWGGINALQVAACQPPALKAIITLCSTDDRYADDAHYMGGCLLNENLNWGAVLFTFNALPPDPALVGERWRDLWRARLENSVLFPEVWLRHQRRDAYWRHGSVCKDLSRIACPVYAIGGWADAYSNSIPRLLERLTVPRKGLIGPWAHTFPHEGTPGPGIGFLQEALRWWDQWLKGIDHGLMDEPMYRVWMQENVPPHSFYKERPGRWVAEPSWPSPQTTWKRFVLASCHAVEQFGTELRLAVQSPQTTGLTAGDWCGFGVGGERPTDQREDDGKSLTFDFGPLAERLEILGAPVVMLELAADRPNALVAVRLNDVSPTGASTRVTYGLLNLTHRSSHEQPEPLGIGGRYRVRVQLNDIAHAFPAGHTIRVAVSTSYWPVVWPSPEPVTLSVFPRFSHLELPARPPRPEDESLRPFEEPECAPSPVHTTLHPAECQRTIQHDLATNETVYTILGDGGDFAGTALARIQAIDLDVGHMILKRFWIGEEDPLSARAENIQTIVLRRSDWTVRIETRTRLSAATHAFHLQAELEAYEGDACIFSRDWDRTIPRDSV
jgi:putative CocE/NonD family hydrolase